MRRIGVRELRQRASEFLRDVEHGETVEVTARGRAVARIVPVRGETARDRLHATGRVAAAKGDLLELGAPVSPRAGVRPPSDVLRRARHRER
jgi:prevent-host-death family protein